MKKILALIIAATMVLALVPMTALAAEVTVNYDSSKSDVENGNALYAAIMGAADGDTIKVGPGKWELTDGMTSRIIGKSVTIAGSGTDKTTIVGQKYGLVLQNEDPNTRVEMTIKDMKITSIHSWGHPIYAKNNITVNLENLVLENPGTTAILLDSSNAIGGANYNGIDTIVNATNVTIDAGDLVQFNAAPCSSTSTQHETYTHFNYSNCTNITDEVCVPQNVSVGYDNHYVNGQVINPDPNAPTPIPEEAPIPETGDGMGIFVFAGLALLSMLGMVAMKKREQY